MPCVFPRSCSHQSLPIDRRYHRLRYETFIDGKPAPVEKVIGRARLRVNGRDIVALPLACIRALNQELGVPDRENAVTLWLADPRSASPAETAWDMYGEHDFTAVLWMCEKIDGTPSICGEMTFDYGHTLDGSGKIVKKVIHRHALTLSDGGEMIREIHAASFDET
ncbi:hypothetical protein Ga0100230_004630 [Opitutaceae bacterium TAV3]|nr:hypothetical protein Ga0100230_004630 [Opitutaceae bacterium TAV3]